MLPTAVGASEGPNHPSPTQSFFHQCPDPSCSYDCLRGKLAGIDYVAGTVIDGNQPLDPLARDVLAEATLPPPTASRDLART